MPARASTWLCQVAALVSGALERSGATPALARAELIAASSDCSSGDIWRSGCAASAVPAPNALNATSRQAARFLRRIGASLGGPHAQRRSALPETADSPGASCRRRGLAANSRSGGDGGDRVLDRGLQHVERLGELCVADHERREVADHVAVEARLE